MTTLVKPFAFVLMPFAPEFDDIYKLGIQKLAEEKGVVAERVDEQIYSETMLERIYRQIDAADFIIADLTGRNPNVFYEIGFAHARQKMCTLLTQNAEDIPFDLKHHRHLVYGGKIQRLRELLSPELDWLKAELERSRSSTFTVELKKVRAELTKTEWKADAEVELVIDIHNRTDRRTPEIEAIYLNTGKGWAYSQNGEDCASTENPTDSKVMRHFLKAPITRLSPDGWAQLALKGRRRMWSKYTGKDDVKDKYPLKGYVNLDIVTSEGTFSEKLSIETVAEEYPF
ncbi:hypothetical protein CN205_32250 [Sinorhizobium meliloti]|uniref:hypothetical protein n=1 Tax=Rhizobium meliloti TaxID=382 RepID=UPI000FDC7B99|nr:hypothetical protein [Sinorhizobium meliloti]RVI00606.1 hypothetical protein CN205_32250 [Sinorhizobium meliloti]